MVNVRVGVVGGGRQGERLMVTEQPVELPQTFRTPARDISIWLVAQPGQVSARMPRTQPAEPQTSREVPHGQSSLRAVETAMILGLFGS